MQVVAQAFGPIPGWLPLGPVVEIEGLPAREVLGDWSHLNECDRPPKYIRECESGHNSHLGFDTSETRQPIKQIRPGRPIAELKGRHSGRVAILFNGESLAQHDLHKVKVPIIGINRTHVGFPGYNGPQPDYLCIVDWAYFDKPEWRASVVRHPALINGSDHRADIPCWRATRHPRMAPFSFDLERDGFAGPIPCTTGHLALQVAVYMGFTEIHCLGFDLGGKHFNGSGGSLHYPDAVRYHARQVPLLTERGIRVFTCGSPQSRAPFPHSSFEAVC